MLNAVFILLFAIVALLIYHFIAVRRLRQQDGPFYQAWLNDKITDQERTLRAVLHILREQEGGIHARLLDNLAVTEYLHSVQSDRNKAHALLLLGLHEHQRFLKQLHQVTADYLSLEQQEQIRTLLDSDRAGIFGIATPDTGEFAPDEQTVVPITRHAGHSG